MAKAWPEAGEAFSKAVELHVKLGSTYDAANAAQEAAACFKNVRACFDRFHPVWCRTHTLCHPITNQTR